MSFQLMKERIKQSGSTLYHEQIKDALDILKYGFCEDVSYNPNIVFYKSNNKIPIKIYDQKYSASYGVTAKYLAMHTIPVELGQLLCDVEKNEYWLCVESYDVSGIHNEGKLGKCNRFLKWQDNNGVIKEIPAIITTASKYNNGENGTEVVYIGSDQLMIFVPLNEDTVKLNRNIRLIIDENKECPTVYRITRIDTALYTYMGKGFISIIATESTYKPSEKEIQLGICDYVEIDSASSPPLSDQSDILPDILARISGNTQLKAGITRTYSVNFINKSGAAIDWRDVNFSWSIKSSFDVQCNKNENWISLLVDDESLIGETFFLQLLSDNKCIEEIKISIIDVT